VTSQQFEGFNLWIDGTSYYGQIKSLELPELETETTDKMTIAGIGTQELPRLFAAMEATITSSQYSENLSAIGADHRTTRVFQIFGSIGEHQNGQALSKQKVITLRGRIKNFEGGELNSEDEVEHELTIAVDSYKHEYDNQTVFDISIDPPRYVVNGQNLIAERNNNLGIV